ncbi:MAG: sigma-E factor negative regulatory protein [Leucothrix sp.]
MSHITKEEHLSALLDDEAGSFEQHRICDQLLTDDELQDKLASYALIGEAMRGRSSINVGAASPSFLSGIQDAIAGEAPLVSTANSADTDTIKAPSKKRALPKQAVGYAIAASVAAVAAVGFQNYTATPQSVPSVATATLNKTAVPSTQSTNIDVAAVTPVVKKAAKTDYFVTTSFEAPDAKTRGMMNKYVAHHLRYASSSTLMPRVRAVSYSTDF